LSPRRWPGSTESGVSQLELDTALNVADHFLPLRSGSVYIWGITMVDMSKIGRKGGLARVHNQTPEERSESARHAAQCAGLVWVLFDSLGLDGFHIGVGNSNE
jgi:hypothetical protein